MLEPDVLGLVGHVLDGGLQVQEARAATRHVLCYRGTDERGKPREVRCLRVPPHVDTAVLSRNWERFRSRNKHLLAPIDDAEAMLKPLAMASTVVASGAFVPYMVFEAHDGETLARLAELERGALPETLHDWVRLFNPVAEALHKVHRAADTDGRLGTPHLAIAPEHLLLVRGTERRTLKILGFGLAGALNELCGRACAPIAPAYGAPEQWLPEQYGSIGPWTDVWALALSISRLYAGAAEPADHELISPEDVLRVASRSSPRALGAGVSDAVDAVFVAALALDPRQRQTDVGVFWAQLQRSLEQRQGGLSGYGGQRFFEQPVSVQDQHLALELDLQPSQSDDPSAPVLNLPSAQTRDAHPRCAVESLQAVRNARVEGPVVRELVPSLLGRVRYGATLYLPGLACAVCAVGIAVCSQWFAGQSGQALKIGPVPPGALVALLIGLSGVQVIGAFGRR